MGVYRRAFPFNFNLPRGTKYLLIINSAIFLFFFIGINFFKSKFINDVFIFLSLNRSAITSGYVWKFFTYMFLHSPTDILHIVFNMLVLYFFGPLFERRWGTYYFVRFYLISGVGAGIIGTILGFIPIFGSANQIIIGASGALLAFIVAFAIIFKHQKVLLFFVVPVSGKDIIIALIIIDLILVLTGSNIAVNVHLGGMIMGYFLITGNYRPSNWKNILNGLKGKGYKIRRIK